MSKELPTEIWRQIVKWLRQPLPPAGDPDVTWKQLHQQDLTVMMRVSKEMHEHAAHVLYSEIVVDNPAGLLRGIDRRNEKKEDTDTPDSTTDSPSDDSKPTRNDQGRLHAPIRKRDLLALVTGVHYIYSPLDRDRFAQYPQGSCLPYESHGASLDRSLRQGDFSRYTDVPVALAGEPVDELFPRLVRRSLCAWTPQVWYYRTTGESNMDWDLVELLAKAVRIPAPSFICGTGEGGPLGHFRATLPPDTSIGATAPKTEVQVVHYDHPRRDINILMPPYTYIAPGTQHFWDMAIPLEFAIVTEDLTVFTSGFINSAIYMMCAVAAQWEKTFDLDLIAKTRVTFVFPRPAVAFPTIFTVAADEKAMSTAQNTLESARENMEGEAQKWARRMDYVWADTVPPCPACGRSYAPPAPTSNDNDQSSENSVA